MGLRPRHEIEPVLIEKFEEMLGSLELTQLSEEIVRKLGGLKRVFMAGGVVSGGE